MELVREPRLREIIEQITPLLADSQAPAVRQPPADPVARDAWFTEVTQERAKQQAQMSGGGRSLPTIEGVEVSEIRIPVTGGCGWSGCPECTAGSINAIVYRPAEVATAPAYLHFHGGGFWIGGGLDVLRASATVHGARARELGVVVIDVDYRMAPEHKFPIPVEDCYTALTWVASHADQLGVDPARLAVGGGSAGGNLTAAVALMSRDRGGPALSAQVLNIPVTDSSCNTASMHLFAEGYVMTRQNALEMWDMYLASPADAHHPYASPMHAPSLRGLPPTLVVLGDYDVLRDEGSAYARRLVDDGVTVTMRRLPQTHGAGLPENGPETERLINELLRANLLKN
ncbi:acetyl esterase [Streptomyces sp. SAI-117]|jgi:acetyl esterase|uniref:alpha/beta hydrolase n=1 Tax=unclassified Streptomyces TaxID=2593676 RepID=UPI0024757873|nr:MULTISPECIES: alpha/beta hydrolase [unclassified Streptomyces]MDH6573722.1 acetyl esterase [Streptomyces sp. SAI-117]MDH6581547.1 acetyl esterase [Streptomyces sp. SAI-133]